MIHEDFLGKLINLTGEKKEIPCEICSKVTIHISVSHAYDKQFPFKFISRLNDLNPVTNLLIGRPFICTKCGNLIFVEGLICDFYNNNKKDINTDKVDILTYDDLIQYFFKSKPNDSRIKKGVIVYLSMHKKQFVLIQTYLDKNDNVLCNSSNSIYGRKIIANEIDNELQEIFQENPVLIIV